MDQRGTLKALRNPGQCLPALHPGDPSSILCSSALAISHPGETKSVEWSLSETTQAYILGAGIGPGKLPVGQEGR